MLSLAPIGSASSAAGYYGAEENYQFSGELEASWYGKGAEELGLQGRIEPDELTAVLEGRLPDGADLTRMKDGENVHRAGYDLTFSAPKSVSMLALIGDDKRFLDAHNQAVKDTIAEVEQLVSTRITTDKVGAVVPTGNLVAALYTHDTSRNLDPQLHTHALIANATQHNDAWRSLSSSTVAKNGFMETMFAAQVGVGLIYRNHLRQSVEGMGFETVTTGRNGLWEIKGVPTEPFSTRRNEIVELAGQHASDKTKDYVTLETRRGKEELDPAQVRQNWDEKLDAVGFDIKGFIAERDSANRQPPVSSTVDQPAVQEAVQSAISIAAGDRSRFTYSELLNLALNRVPVGHGVIPAIRHEIDAAIANNSLVALDENKSSFSSRVHIQTELEVHSLSQQIQGDVLVKLRSTSVASEQPAIREAFARNESIAVLSSLGGAERQLTFLDELAKEASNGKRSVTVIGADKALTERFAETSTTKAKIAHRSDITPELALQRNGVVIVSDAQKLSLKESKTLLEAALQANSQVLLVDTEGRRGHGNAMGIIKEAGISVYENSGRVDIPVGINSIPARNERIEAIADSYLDLRKEGQEVVAQAGTAPERKQLTHAIRDALKTEGLVRGPTATIESLEPVFLTNETRQQRDSYRDGQVLEQWNPSTKSATRYRIVNVSERANKVLMHDEDGNRRIMKPNQFDSSWSLYNSTKIEVAEGDRLRTFGKDRQRGLDAREELTVTQVKNGKATLEGDAVKVRVQDGEALKIGYNYVQSLGGQVKGSGTVLASLMIKSLNAETLNTLARSGERIELFTAENPGRAQQKIAQIPRYTPVINTLRAHSGQTQPAPAIEQANRQLYTELERDVRDGMKTARGSEVAFNLGDLTKAVLSANHTYQLKDVREELTKLQNTGELMQVDTPHAGQLYIERNTYLNEKNILGQIVQGKSAVEPLMSSAPAHVAAGLTTGQQEATTLILTTTDRFVGIQGYAGVGKTTQYKAVVQALETLGDSKPTIVGLAPTHQAVNELQSIGVQAQTISSFLVEQERLQGSGETSDFKNTLFLIDEQSMTGNDHLSRLYDQIAAGGGRAVSSGDTAQLQAIDAGSPFRLIQQRSAADFAIMKEIVRQSPELLPAVYSMIDKDVHAALKTIDSLSPSQVERRPGAYTPERSVMTIPDNPSLFQAIAQDYAGRTAPVRDGTLVIAHTNADRTAINNEIHTALKAGGELGTSEVEVPVLVREKTTGSQLNNAANYLDHVGQILLMRDTYYAIEGVDTQAKTVALRPFDSATGLIEGASVLISPAEHRTSDIALYRQDSIRVSEGEKLRFTATNKDEGIFANRPYSVVEIAPDKSLVLQDRDGDRLTVQPQGFAHQHFDYAYAVTAYGAQGASHPYVIALEGVEGGRKNLATLQDAYVAFSRAKEHVQVYSDNPDKWARKVSKSAERATAHDLVHLQEDRKTAVAVELWKGATQISQTLLENPGNLNARWMGSTQKHPQPSLLLPTFDRAGHQVGVLLYDIKPGEMSNFSPDREHRQLGAEHGDFVVLRTSNDGKTQLFDNFNEAHQFTQAGKDTGVIVRLKGETVPLNPERISGGAIEMSDKQIQVLAEQLAKDRRNEHSNGFGIDAELLLREKSRQPLLTDQELKDFVRQQALQDKALEQQANKLAANQSKEDLQTTEREIIIVPDRIKEKTL
jgi:conjugative transfer relaxase protein TraI